MEQQKFLFTIILVLAFGNCFAQNYKPAAKETRTVLIAALCVFLL
jgi:hypothetical protein